MRARELSRGLGRRKSGLGRKGKTNTLLIGGVIFASRLGELLNTLENVHFFPPRGVPPGGVNFGGPGGPSQKPPFWPNPYYVLIGKVAKMAFFRKIPKNPQNRQFSGFSCPRTVFFGGENSAPPEDPPEDPPRTPPDPPFSGVPGDPRFWALFPSGAVYVPSTTTSWIRDPSWIRCARKLPWSIRCALMHTGG